MKKLLTILMIIIPALSFSQSCTHSYTGNPYMPMNVVITEIVTDGYEIKEGDIIAVYDDSICVGYTKIKDTGLCTIVLYADDPITPEVDGYTEDNRLIFVFCSNSTFAPFRVKEKHMYGEEYFTHLGTWVGKLKIKN